MIVDSGCGVGILSVFVDKLGQDALGLPRIKCYNYDNTSQTGDSENNNFLRKVNSLHDREIPLVNEGFELESTHFNVVCSSSVPALNDNLYVPDVFLYDIGWYEQLNINTHRVIYEYDTMIAVSVRNGMKHDFLGS